MYDGFPSFGKGREGGGGKKGRLVEKEGGRGKRKGKK